MSDVKPKKKFWTDWNSYERAAIVVPFAVPLLVALLSMTIGNTSYGLTEQQQREDEEKKISRKSETNLGQCSGGRADPQGWDQVVPDCNETGDWLVDCDRKVDFLRIRTVRESRETRRICSWNQRIYEALF